MRIALVNTDLMQVEFISEWDGRAWIPPGVYMLVASDTAQMWDHFNINTGTFTPGEPPAVDPGPEDGGIL